MYKVSLFDRFTCIIDVAETTNGLRITASTFVNIFQCRN